MFSSADLLISHTRWVLAALDFETKLLAYALHGKAYDPNELRVPRRNPGAGEWTDGGWTAGGPDVGAKPEGNEGSFPDARVQLASNAPNDDLPKIPTTRPPTARERNRAIRQVVRSPGKLGLWLEAASWLYEALPTIKAYFDGPLPLDELQRNALTPERGYDIHHVVEQTSAEQDGFPRSQIDGPDNLVRISTLKHWEINAWYQTAQEEFNYMTPREYLRGKSWDERRQVGLRALVDFGILKP